MAWTGEDYANAARREWQAEKKQLQAENKRLGACLDKEWDGVAVDKILTNVEQLQAELAEAKQVLLEFGRNSEGCNYPCGKLYGCKCGWPDIEQALERSKDE